MNELLEIAIKSVAAVGAAIVAAVTFVRKNNDLAKGEIERMFQMQIEAIKRAHAEDIDELKGRVLHLEQEVNTLIGTRKEALNQIVRILQDPSLNAEARDALTSVVALLN